jgi:iron complex outermembrane recepter protein
MAANHPLAGMPWRNTAVRSYTSTLFMTRRATRAASIEGDTLQVWISKMAAAVLAVVACVGVASAAQESGEIVGRVTDASGSIVVGASVTAISAPLGVSRSTTTGAKGEFRLEGLLPGEYDLTFTRAGFADVTRRAVRVHAAGVTDATATLQVPAFREETTVETRARDIDTIGSRLGLPTWQTPASVDIVTQAAMQERGAETTVDALRGVTGITGAIRTGAAGVFSSRGFTENSLGILFDGVRVQSSTVTTRTYDAFNFDRVEVLRGPASVLYGEGSAIGAINFVRRQPASGPLHAEGMLEGGTADKLRLGAALGGSAGDRVAYTVSMAKQRFDTHVESNSHDYNQLVAAVRVAPRPSLSFTLEGDVLHNTIDNAYWGTPLVNGRIDDRLRDANYNKSSNNLYRDDVKWLRGSGNWVVSPHVAYKGQVYRYAADRDWRNSYGFEFLDGPVPQVNRRAVENLAYDHDLWGTRHDVTLDAQFGAISSRTVLGGELSRTDFSSPRSYGARVTVDAFQPQALDFNAPERADDRRAQLAQAAAFVEQRLTLSAGTTIIAGLRADHLDLDIARPVSQIAFSKRFDPVNGRVGVVQNVNARVSLYGQFATGSEPVDALLILDPALRDFTLARTRQWEAGAKSRWWQGRAELIAAFYHIVKRNLTTTDPNNSTTTIQIGQQSSRGVEVTLAMRPTERWQLDVNVSRLGARFDRFFEGTADRSGNLPPNVPETVANADATLRATSKVDVGGRINVIGVRAADATNSVKLPRYTLVEPFVRYRVSSSLDVTARLRNATDETYIEWATRSFGVTNVLFGGPRRFDVTLRARF